METMKIKVKANYHVKNDVTVTVRIDTSAINILNVVTLYFQNGNYCDINIKKFYQVGRYLSTYENVYAVEEFIKGLKDGSITIEEVKELNR